MPRTLTTALSKGNAVFTPVPIVFMHRAISLVSVEQLQIPWRSASAFMQRQQLREGLQARVLPVFARELGVTVAQIESVIGLHQSSRKRYADSDKALNPAQSERLMRIAEIEALASEVFDSKESAVRWLSQPLAVMENETPLQLLDTEQGAMHVRQTLSAIMYGGGF
jgi:putative toxin-antitoxin system antitoxin component (TIGR02293 family)